MRSEEVILITRFSDNDIYREIFKSIVDSKHISDLSITPLCNILCESVPLAAIPPKFCLNHRQMTAEGR